MNLINVLSNMKTKMQFTVASRTPFNPTVKGMLKQRQGGDLLTYSKYSLFSKLFFKIELIIYTGLIYIINILLPKNNTDFNNTPVPFGGTDYKGYGLANPNYEKTLNEFSKKN